MIYNFAIKLRQMKCEKIQLLELDWLTLLQASYVNLVINFLFFKSIHWIVFQNKIRNYSKLYEAIRRVPVMLKTVYEA